MFRKRKFSVIAVVAVITIVSLLVLPGLAFSVDTSGENELILFNSSLLRPMAMGTAVGGLFNATLNCHLYNPAAAQPLFDKSPVLYALKGDANKISSTLFGFPDQANRTVNDALKYLGVVPSAEMGNKWFTVKLNPTEQLPVSSSNTNLYNEVTSLTGIVHLIFGGSHLLSLGYTKHLYNLASDLDRGSGHTIGFRYYYANKFGIGLYYFDSDVNLRERIEHMVPESYNLGFSYYLISRNRRGGQLLHRLAFTADIRDITNWDKHQYLHAGAEWTYMFDPRFNLIVRGGAYTDPDPEVSGEGLGVSLGTQLKFYYDSSNRYLSLGYSWNRTGASARLPDVNHTIDLSIYFILNPPDDLRFTK